MKRSEWLKELREDRKKAINYFDRYARFSVRRALVVLVLMVLVSLGSVYGVYRTHSHPVTNMFFTGLTVGWGTLSVFGIFLLRGLRRSLIHIQTLNAYNVAILAEATEDPDADDSIPDIMKPGGEDYPEHLPRYAGFFEYAAMKGLER